MYVLEVIPFSRTAPQAPLSYRSRTEFPLGSLISIPLRKKTVLGLVVGSLPVQEAKAEIKSASFSLSKSIAGSHGQLPLSIVTAAQKSALYHATSLGAVLSALLIPILPTEESATFWNELSDHTKAAPEIERIEAPFIERKKIYENVLGEKTTLLVVPTQTEVEVWAELLKEARPVLLSGKITGKRREAALARTSQSPSPALVIATPAFSWVPIPNLGRIIIERVSAGSYTLPQRPYLDTRICLTELVAARGILLLYGDYPLPLEYRTDPAAPISGPHPGNITLFDARKDKTKAEKSPEAWHAIPPPVLSDIQETVGAGGRIAILAIRRGYAPSVVCRDCGTTVTDDQGRTLSLATIKGVRVFRSTDGSVTPATEVFCKVCGGWNLSPLGIGIERIEEELRAAFPDAPLVRIDQDNRNVRSLKKARAELLVPGTIIIGTEMMLPFISAYAPVELGIIASADSLLALPFWRARERFVRIGCMLAERAERAIVVTRHPEDAAISALTNIHDPSFWQEETNLRRTLSYPPFGTLIVFHIEGVSASLLQLRDIVKTACAPYTPYELPEQAVIAQGKKVLRSSLVLQLPVSIWPDASLAARLAQLPPSIRVHIDSEMLW